MRWIVRSTEQGYEAKWWLDDSEARVVRFEVPENSIHVWRLATRKLFGTLPGAVPLLSAAFRVCEFSHPFEFEDEQEAAILERVAFCKFLFALKLESPSRQEVLSLASEDLDVLAVLEKHTVVFSDEWPYRWILWSPNLSVDVQGNPFAEEIDTSRWEYALEEKYAREQSYETLADFLDHQDLLREIVRQRVRHRPEAPSTTEQNYVALLRAVVRFLETVQDRGATARSALTSPAMLRLSRKYRPWLCAQLVENEALPLDNRREYLEEIFAHRLPYDEEKSLLLDKILPDLAEDAGDRAESVVAMETIASLMAQHYLSLYALDDAIAIWQRLLAVKKDPPLRGLLSLYQRPGRYLGVIGLLILLSFLPILGIYFGAVTFLPSLLLLSLFLAAALYGLMTILVRLIRQQGFSYLELFLPRLLGSIVVGLSIFALESTLWETTLSMPWMNWALIVFASFIGALAYFFLDVHKNTRLLPTDVNDAERQDGPKRPVSSMARSSQTTFRIFAIGVLEALVLTTLISSLLPFETAGCGEAVLSWTWFEVLADGVFVFKVGCDNGLTLVYSPKVVVLWAGLALLIGAFAQLLWQDRQITAS